MKKFIFLLLTILSFEALAKCETWTRFGVPVEMCWIQDYRGYFSKKCETNCEARTFLDKHEAKPTHIDRTGGKNPASQYCLVLGFSVIVMNDEKLSQQSFCEFPDKSLVDTNALARSLR